MFTEEMLAAQHLWIQVPDSHGGLRIPTDMDAFRSPEPPGVARMPVIWNHLSKYCIICPFSMKRARVLGLGVGIVALFVASRILYLWFSHPLDYLFYGIEELYRGSIAREVARGLSCPFYSLRADDYSGGSLVVGWLASWTFRLLGPTVLSLKLVPLTFFCGTLVLWQATLRRMVGARAALLVACLFVFSPPTFTVFSLTAMGFHSESTLFSAVAVYLFFDMLYGRGFSWQRGALFGLVCGFGLWFTYIFGITLLAMGFYVLVQRQGVFSIRRFSSVAVGFVVGFSPWFWAYFSGMANGLWILKRFSLHHLLEGFTLPREFFGYYFLRAFYPEVWSRSDAIRRLANRGFVLLLVLLGFALAWRAWNERPGRSSPRLQSWGLVQFSFLYIVLLGLAMQWFEINSESYRIPFFPFLFALIAMGLDHLAESRVRWHSVLCAAILSGWVGLSLVSNGYRLSTQFAGAAFTAKGYSYRCLPGDFCDSISDCLRFERSRRPQLDREDAFELSTETASSTVEMAAGHGVSADLLGWATQMSLPQQKYFYFFAGQQLIIRERWDPILAVRFLTQKMSPDSPAFEWTAQGLFDRYDDKIPKPDLGLAWAARASRQLPPQAQAMFWRAIGKRTARWWAGRAPSPETLCQQVRQQYQPGVGAFPEPFAEGLGQFFFEKWNEDPRYTRFVPEWLAGFPPALQADLFRGAGMEFGISQLLGLVSEGHFRYVMFTQSLDGTQRLAFDEGNREISLRFDIPN
jgi:hypothetical protein